MKYADQLKTKEWKARRLEILERDNHTCTQCGSKEKLQVHHLYYRKTKLAWEYPDKALTTLCSVCHEDEHLDKLDGYTVITVNYKFTGDTFRLLLFLSSLRRKQKSDVVKVKISDASNAIKVTDYGVQSMLLELSTLSIITSKGRNNWKLNYKDKETSVQEN